MHSRERTPVPGGLPAPAPLPSLTSALSRRAALFGAVASTGFLAAAGASAMGQGMVITAIPPALDPADARLVALADELEALERTCNAFPCKGDDDPVFDDLAAGFGPLEEEIADIPADTLKGILAKIRALDVPTTGVWGNPGCHDIMVSITEDVSRLHAKGALNG